jgi:uncharacterized membrane protein YidH (DUF202 family)
MGVSGAVSVDTKHRVWKAHMKMALANERTLIAWLRVGATYGAGAVVATALSKEMVNDDRGFTLTVQALLGLLVVAWGTAQFVRRGRLLAQRWHGSYESCWGPAIFTLASVISVLLTVRPRLARSPLPSSPSAHASPYPGGRLDPAHPRILLGHVPVPPR